MTREERHAIEHECARLISAYANFNDAGEFRALADLYVDEGRLARPSAPDAWISGREAIYTAFRERPKRITRHLCTNIVISVIDAETAVGESAIALFSEGGGVKLGSFFDRFCLTEAGWRFVERRGTMII